MITNPESATKERLKAELKRAGVGFDAHENKDYYVQLYRAHVMRPKGGGAAKGKARRSEFSSDEETVIKTRGSPRKQERPTRHPKSAKAEAYLASVTRLSDQELMDELRRFGEDPGPITATTKSLYQKQLAKCVSEKAKASSQARREEANETSESFIAEWSSESEDADRVAIPRVSTPQVSEPPPRAKTRSQTRLQAAQARSQVDGGGVRERLPHRAEEREEGRRRPRSGQHSRGGGGEWWSFFANIVLLLWVLAMAYLAYDHYTHGQESLVYQAYLGILTYLPDPDAPPTDAGAPPTKAPPTEAPPTDPPLDENPVPPAETLPTVTVQEEKTKG